MIEFTETITIDAPAPAVWQIMRDVEAWWPRSNPDHESLTLLDGAGEIGSGTRMQIRERIAGVRGEAIGTIVWATVAPGLLGVLTRLVFVHLLDGEARDRVHTRTELRYLKSIIESAIGRDPR